MSRRTPNFPPEHSPAYRTGYNPRNKSNWTVIPDNVHDALETTSAHKVPYNFNVLDATQDYIISTYYYGQLYPGSGLIYQDTVADLTFSATEGFIAPYDGSIIAHSVQVNITRADTGQLAFQPVLSGGTNVALNVIFPSGTTGTSTDYVTLNPGAVTFSAGTILSARVSDQLPSGGFDWENVFGKIVVRYELGEAAGVVI